MSTATQTTRIRLTRRGRAVLTTLAAAPLVAALAAGVLNSGAAVASRDEGAAPASFETIRVQSGDTLWAIAERIAPQADPRDVVAEIQSLNQISASDLVAGDELAIPADLS